MENEISEEKQLIKEEFEEYVLQLWGLTMAVSLLISLVEFDQKMYFVLIPAIGFESFLIALKIWKLLNESHSNLYETLKNNPEMIKITNSFSFLSIEILSFLYFINSLNLFIIYIPYIANFLGNFIIRAKYKYAFQSFSRYIELILNSISFVTLIFISLKLEGTLDWNWKSIFWPFWTLIVFLLIIALLYTVLLIWEICYSILGRGEYLEYIAPIWFFILTLLVATELLVFFWNLSAYLEKEEESLSFSFIFIFCSSLGLLAFTHIFKERILEVLYRIWWFTILIKEEIVDEGETLETENNQNRNSLMKLLKRPQMYLISVSKTFFKPISNGYNKVSLSLIIPNNADEIEREQVSLEIQEKCEISEIPCSICCDVKADSVFMTFGHGGLCFCCATQIWNTSKECHICRNTIIEIMVVQPVESGIVEVIRTHGYEDSKNDINEEISSNTEFNI